MVCANEREAAVAATPSSVANSRGQHQEPIRAGILMKRDKKAIAIDFLSKSSPLFKFSALGEAKGSTCTCKVGGWEGLAHKPSAQSSSPPLL